MRETRRDPTTGRWTVISTERVERPVHLEPRALPPVPESECPFCPGHEHATGKAIDHVGKGKDWTIRVVPNKYPFLSVGEVESSRAFGLYDAAAMDAVDAFRKDHGLAFEGNPRGLVDERFVQALRAAWASRALAGLR